MRARCHCDVFWGGKRIRVRVRDFGSFESPAMTRGHVMIILKADFAIHFNVNSIENCCIRKSSYVPYRDNAALFRKGSSEQSVSIPQATCKKARA